MPVSASRVRGQDSGVMAESQGEWESLQPGAERVVQRKPVSWPPDEYTLGNYHYYCYHHRHRHWLTSSGDSIKQGRFAVGSLRLREAALCTGSRDSPSVCTAPGGFQSSPHPHGLLGSDPHKPLCEETGMIFPILGARGEAKRRAHGHPAGEEQPRWSAPPASPPQGGRRGPPARWHRPGLPGQQAL